MVVDAGTRANGAEHEPRYAVRGEGAARGGPASASRRQLIRGLLVPAVAVGLAPLIGASRPTEARDAAAPAHPEPHTAEPVRDGESAGFGDSAAFDETYRGRRIRGIRSAAGRAVGAGTWHVTVDGRPLHLMRRADGSWLSMVDHYRSYPTPLAAARGAVDELGPGEHLRDTPSTGHDQHSGGRHGVHA
ncbi:tyrosinase family oxidase copper chaperone [Streptomyces salinarius]|uniref:tyrosinase family oxidase copper chaperone n=1 Tax=Streptomyces salinarius TaxID=2762598 RepID=UPI0013D8E6C3|nr:tyrosinase family oxidase copper chaperone [Streptomyces salinarius]